MTSQLPTDEQYPTQRFLAEKQRFADEQFPIKKPRNSHLQPANKRSGGRFILQLVFDFILALGIAFLLRFFVFGVYTVPTGSMLETIQENTIVIGEKITPHFVTPARGSIVTFSNPKDPDITLIKRVVAVAGDQIDLRDGVVYLNGEAQNEPYTLGKTTASLSNMAGSAHISYPYTIPDGCVWVMGDNRTNSLDSRYFGAIPTTRISSHALGVFWPLHEFALF